MVCARKTGDEFVDTLLEWYVENGRHDLPWRACWVGYSAAKQRRNLKHPKSGDKEKMEQQREYMRNI